MRRALELALLGPAWGVNPQVGCVILDADGQIIAEGWHRGAGTAHAEVDALSKLATVPSGATAVVTLEPCNHTGRTGPCAQALVAAGISRVVYAVADPGVESSKGAQTLRDAGVVVLGGVLEGEASQQNRVWLTAQKNQRPFVTLKWASSIDGRAAANDGTSKWISGPESRADSHRRRSEVDAILVGTGTILADDAELTARKPDGSLYEHQPLRVVIGESELPASSRVFNSDAGTIHLRTREIEDVLKSLWQKGVKHVWVEGGPSVASEFVRLGLVSEYIIYQAPLLLGGERTALREIGVASMPQAKHLRFVEVKQLGEDIFIRAIEEKA
ncbi:MAG: bifunctional diaminohydroxyphosphoribosylaminopyrimidine deaminase/5-amino-6-(5-phosphoribosylamino)uracil reductase RibD [Marivivens sp.]|nr:bifunctional diaminohydroxyphosphoribosylaminopyrimidine deaminase/5-amino-6-(5-phosphoribosylamino)uracil reductase RibD [Marivivens sp.]